MKSSWVLARLERETRPCHAAADADRLVLMTAATTREAYVSWLARVYGFEAPVESALQMTAGLDEVVDLRSRTAMRPLRWDLIALDVPDPSRLPQCSSVFPFRSPADALGWIYVLERNAMLHGVLRRHLEPRLRVEIANAGAYLAVGARMQELGADLDAFATSPDIADRIVDAAQAAFHRQHDWFAELVPPHAQVA